MLPPFRIFATALGLLMATAPCSGAGSPISAGATWRYLDSGVDAGTAWREPGFDDSPWAFGPGQLGFGDGDEATVLRSGIVTAYFRKRFSVADPATAGNLTLRVLRDDGVAVYLNGVEVFRNNLPSGPLSHGTLAIAAIGGAEETTAFVTTPVAANLLVAGENLIAAEVHQINLTSSDLSFDLELLADNAPPPPDLPAVAVQAVDNTAAEGTADRGRFRLVRSGSTSDLLNVSVTYSGTAMNGEDIVSLPTTVEIPAGSATADLEIVALDDGLVEGAETLTLSLVEPACANQNPPGPGCYRVGAPSQASASIVDKDFDPPPPPAGTNILIASNSVWKFLDNGTDQGSAWRMPGFNDSSWASGPGQLGYGDGDEATVVSFGPDPANRFITTYFRHTFDVADPLVLSNLVLNVLSDDGVAVYLNGVEVFRLNLPAGPITFNTPASSVVVDENAYTSVSISTAPLVTGRNVIAAEVHQVNPASSDLGFDLALLVDGSAPPPPPPPGLPVVRVQATDGSAAEPGLDPGLFRITRTGATTEPLTVTLSYGGSAENGVDCIELPLTVEIPAGSSFVELIVDGLDDNLAEGTETLILSIVEPPCALQNPEAPGCYRVGIPGQAGVTILDDDPFPPPPPGTFVTLISSNSVWGFLDDGSDQGTSWSTHNYDDSGWAFGPGQLGYGDADEATVVSFGPDPSNKHITTYFRHRFEVADVLGFSNLVLRVLHDDGVVAYLNETEVFRNNLPAGPISFNTLALSAVSEENAYVEAVIPRFTLRNGRNLIAVEVHQVNPISSDLGFDLALVGTLGELANEPPAVALMSPADGAVFAEGAAVFFAVEASDPDGVIASVNFLLDGSEPMNASGPDGSRQGTWSLNHEWLQTATHRIAAIVTDNLGAVTISEEVVFSLLAPPDADRDGVPDDRDQCPSTPGGIVVSTNGCVLNPCLPRVEWQASYGGGHLEFLNSVRQLPDGGFVLGGYSLSGDDGNKTTTHLGLSHDFDWWVVRTDSTGAIVWQKSFGGSGNDDLLALELTKDGGFILGGYRRSGNFAATRLDAQGEVVWDREYEDGAVSSIQELPDGGFVLGGWTYAGGVPGDDPELGGGGGTNFRILRTASDGTVIWDRRFGGNAVDQGHVVRQAADGGFIIGGASNSGIGGNKTTPLRGSQDLWIIRLDSNGAVLWEQTYGTGSAEATAIHSLADGTFIVGGSLNAHFHLMRIAANGDVLWENSIGGDAWGMLAALELMPDGGFVLAGRTTEGSQGTKSVPGFGADDYWIVRLDANRNQLWDLTIGGSGNDYLTTMTLAADGGIALGGHSFSGVSGNKTASVFGNTDYWLVKLGRLGNCVDGDNDGDGVPDERDACAGTPPGAIVNNDGCAIAQLAPCAAMWQSHAEYMDSVIRHAWQTYRQGIITADQRCAIIRDAAQSGCGRAIPAKEAARVHLLPLTLEECQRSGLRVVVSCDPLVSCTLETSTDLVHWTVLHTLEAADIGTEVECPHFADEPARFFRVRVLEP